MWYTYSIVIDETKLRETVAKNIAAFRKNMNLTQLELAEKLNYSDKSVSKWERAEAIPDAVVLMQLAELFHVRLDDLMSENASEYRSFTFSIKKRVIIPSMSAILVFFVATLAFAALVWVAPSVERPWLTFIYAIPAAAIVLLVFSAIARHQVLITTFVSIIIWGVALTLFVTFIKLPNTHLFFIVAAPLQVLTILWHYMMRQSKKKK